MLDVHGWHQDCDVSMFVGWLRWCMEMWRRCKELCCYVAYGARCRSSGSLTSVRPKQITSLSPSALGFRRLGEDDQWVMTFRLWV